HLPVVGRLRFFGQPPLRLRRLAGELRAGTASARNMAKNPRKLHATPAEQLGKERRASYANNRLRRDWSVIASWREHDNDSRCHARCMERSVALRARAAARSVAAAIRDS